MSTYVRNPPYFEGINQRPTDITDIDGARILGLFGDKITTDHISPAGSIKPSSPAGEYLLQHNVAVADFNQYGTRRGNHEVMMRGTFANIRIKNFMARDAAGNVKEGGLTVHYPSGEAHVDLRSRHALQGRGRAARRLRRRRIRQRLLARLGGQRHQAARRARRHRAVVRAHPPLQPRRHGHRAVRVRGRHQLAVARPQGRRGGEHPAA